MYMYNPHGSSILIPKWAFHPSNTLVIHVWYPMRKPVSKCAALWTSVQQTIRCTKLRLGKMYKANHASLEGYLFSHPYVIACIYISTSEHARCPWNITGKRKKVKHRHHSFLTDFRVFFVASWMPTFGLQSITATEMNSELLSPSLLITSSLHLSGVSPESGNYPPKQTPSHWWTIF